MDPPVKPDESDCCNSGCNPCILDVYEIQLAKYKKYFREIQNNNAKHIENCIYPSNYSVFKLSSFEKHTQDTYFYTFEYCRPHKELEDVNDGRRLQYKPGQHFLLKGYDKNCHDEFTKAYTPIPCEKNGPVTFTILVRLYKLGRMSSYLSGLKCGEETLWRGPYCDFSINYSLRNILLIAQGTGIAPIYAVIKDMLLNENCDTFLRLFFCCRSINDILIRDELYKCQSYWNFKYEIFLSNHCDIIEKYNEVLHAKRLDKCDLEKFVESVDGLKVIICGSEQFENCIKSWIKECDVKDENIYVF